MEFKVSLFAAYTLEEVDEKTKRFRESVNYRIEDGESTINVSMRIHMYCNYASIVLQS